MKVQFQSMKTRVIFWILTVALAPLLLAYFVIYQQETKVIKAGAFEKLVVIRDLKIRQVNAWIDERQGDLRALSQILENRHLGEIGEGPQRDRGRSAAMPAIVDLLLRYKAAYPDYEDFFILEPRAGRVVFATDHAQKGQTRARASYFVEPLRSGELFITDIYRSAFTNKTTMAFAVPLRERGYKDAPIRGILVAQIDLDHSLYKLLLERAGLGQTGETLIVNQEGLASSELRWHPQAPLRLKIEAEPVRLALAGKAGIVEARDYRGTPVLAAQGYIPKTRWGFVAKIDQSEIYASLSQLFWSLLILLASTAGAVVVIAVFLGRGIARPILAAAEVAKRMQQGDLNARILPPRSDEVGILGAAFNQLADSLTAQMEEERKSSAIVEALIAPAELEEFAQSILRQLMSLTNSDLGAFFRLEEKAGRFEHIASAGVNPELMQGFDAALREGEFGKPLLTRKAAHTRVAPEESYFKFKTFAGTAIPREIVTIPLLVKNKVTGMISLGSVAGYRPEERRIFELPSLLALSTAFANLLANEETRELAAVLADKNQELQAQAEELQAQTEELQQQSEELQEQNVELGRQREEVEEANRLKSQFLANMSHELRTPLNSVMALSRVLIRQAKGKLSAEEGNYLEIIERNGKNLLSMINDILDLAKIEAGRMDLRAQSFSLEATIDNVLENLAPLAEAKGLAVRRSVPANLPPLESDEGRVFQILQNLVGNAIKFTDRGEVAVAASFDREMAHVSIADTGVGIAGKDLPAIFDEFRQADGSTSRRHEGTGLGLTIARKLARKLGGDIAVASELGKGSVFTLSLPIAWEEQMKMFPGGMAGKSPPEGQTEEGRSKEPSGGGTAKAHPRILLVEDNEEAIVQVRSVLDEAGYQVEIARGGKEAIDHVQRRIPDGIILDLMMPGVDGFAVLEKIRGAEATARVPVLILTAKDLTAVDFARLKANNVRQLLQKGDVDRKGLLRKVQEMLANVDAPPRKCAGSPLILIVEDNPDNLTTIKAVLGGRYRLLEAADGEEGVCLARAHLPDLILLDMALPKMDGFAVLGHLKKAEATRKIPVIALTARAMAGEKEKILEAGGDGYVAKPFDPEEILLKIDQWLRK